MKQMKTNQPLQYSQVALYVHVFSSLFPCCNLFITTFDNRYGLLCSFSFSQSISLKQDCFKISWFPARFYAYWINSHQSFWPVCRWNHGIDYTPTHWVSNAFSFLPFNYISRFPSVHRFNCSMWYTFDHVLSSTDAFKRTRAVVKHSK